MAMTFHRKTPLRMSPSSLLLLLVLLLTLTLTLTSGAQSGQSASAVSQLFEKYGSGAGYLIFHFFLYFGSPLALEQRLQTMRASGQLQSLCHYIPRRPASQCLQTTSSSDQQVTVILVAYLNTVCCQEGHEVEPVNGSWGSWGSWGSCSVSCGSGTRLRTRACDSPLPSSGGLSCTGPGSETGFCYIRPCAPTRDCGIFKPRGKILGGQQTVPGRYPWVAMLLARGSLLCGCVIVDHWHVLTAGHCLERKVVNNSLNSNTFEVVAGQFNRSYEILENGAQRVFVVGGLRHPSYNDTNLLNDIAVLRLARPLVFNNNVSTVCLPSATDEPPRKCTAAGWGSLAYFRKDPEALQEVELDTYTSRQCEAVFQPTTNYNISRYLSPGVMCAANGTSGGKDSCKGDSGSGLMCVQADPSGSLYYSIFGIVSSGLGCGNPGQPGFYTYVPYYVDWVRSAIAALSNPAASGGAGWN